MRQKDALLTELSGQIDDAKARLEQARQETTARKADVNEVRVEIERIDHEISLMRTEASKEFEYASLCYDAEDHAGAKEHSVKAHALKARANSTATAKEPIYERLELAKQRFGEALEHQEDVRKELDDAHAAFQARLRELKEQNAREWKEKECAICQAPIRYNVNWTHIPNICQDCRERERAMWQEKPCRRCGEPVRFRIDWDHPPNYCKSCKAELAAQRAAGHSAQAEAGPVEDERRSNNAMEGGDPAAGAERAGDGASSPIEVETGREAPLPNGI